jgi:hypothetical protein
MEPNQEALVTHGTDHVEKTSLRERFSARKHDGIEQPYAPVEKLKELRLGLRGRLDAPELVVLTIGA